MKMFRFVICDYIGGIGNMGCCKLRYIMWNVEFLDLYNKGIIFFIVISIYIVYLKNSRGIINYYFNMFFREGGMEILESKKCCK